MKALTIRQPWASLIALGVKHIETRSWRAPQSLIGQTIAIHAGKALDGRHFDQFGEWSLHVPPYIDGLPQLRRLGAIGPDGNSLVMEHVRVLPLGAVVATATLADCLPMVEMNGDDERDGTCVVLNGTKAHIDHEGEFRLTDIADQLPFGDFQPGRWAWMLTNVQPCDPVPAKGKQGLWEWQP